MTKSATTVIEGGWIVGHDGTGHAILKDGVVVFRGDEILHVGPAWEGAAERVIDARDKLVIPGFVSTHAHVSNHAGDRLIVDAGRRDFQRSGFLNYLPRRADGGPGFLDADDPEASIRYGFASLLRNGVTTVVELGGGAHDGGETMARLAGESGIRLYYAPGFTGGEYVFDRAGRLVRRWTEEEGLLGLDRAAAFIERHDGDHGGRLKGMLVLDEAFNATPRLLRRTREMATRLGAGITLHAAEQVFEFHEILRRVGRTPVAYLEAEGFLGPDVILGHCAYVGGHSLTSYPFTGDLAIIARSGATVAHSPLALARRGATLETFQRYLDHGVNLSIGTDSYPQDMISEMRWASVLCKVVERNNESARARDVFEAATLGGAKALGREDLGRLAPGARADVVLVDLGALRTGPVHDPIRALVHCTTGELVDTVIVAGQTLVEGRRLLVWDGAEVLGAMRDGVARVWDRFSDYHWSGRPVAEIFPPSLKPWVENGGSA